MFAYGTKMMNATDHKSSHRMPTRLATKTRYAEMQKLTQSMTGTAMSIDQSRFIAAKIKSSGAVVMSTTKVLLRNAFMRALFASTQIDGV